MTPPREVDPAAEIAAAEAAIEADELEALEAAVAAAEAEEVLASLGHTSTVVDASGRESYGAGGVMEPGPRKRKGKRKPPPRAAAKANRTPRQEPDPTPELLTALTPKLDPDGILVLRTPTGVTPPTHRGLAEPESHAYGGMTLHFYAVDAIARDAAMLTAKSADRG